MVLPPALRRASGPRTQAIAPVSPPQAGGLGVEGNDGALMCQPIGSCYTE